MMRRIIELLGCRYPILQGATGVICDPELVAVSEAGGFGLLATAFSAALEAGSLPAGEVAVLACSIPSAREIIGERVR
jgi:enoyl-[acyl-carrier protein] reductase II